VLSVTVVIPGDRSAQNGGVVRCDGDLGFRA